jgi:hypothetical protein
MKDIFYYIIDRYYIQALSPYTVLESITILETMYAMYVFLAKLSRK